MMPESGISDVAGYLTVEERLAFFSLGSDNSSDCDRSDTRDRSGELAESVTCDGFPVDARICTII